MRPVRILSHKYHYNPCDGSPSLGLWKFSDDTFAVFYGDHRRFGLDRDQARRAIRRVGFDPSRPSSVRVVEIPSPFATEK